MKRLLALLAFVFLTTGAHGQAVYSEFEPGPNLDRFTHISENMRCLCGCGLVLSTCPHVNCGFGIPARRLIEFMIEAGFSNEQIFDGFNKGLLSLESEDNFDMPSSIARDLKAYYSNPSFANDSAVVPEEAQRKQRLFQYLISRTPEAIPVPKAGGASLKLSRHLDLMIAKERAVITDIEAKLADPAVSGQARSDLERKKGEAFSQVYKLANFRLGYGSRVLATGDSQTSNVMTAVGLLVVALAVLFLIFRRKLLSLRGNKAPKAETATATVADPGGDTQAADDYEDQYKELDQ